jgi:hypothetical protein
MGEIGGNDYNYPFLLRRSMDEVDTFIPLVVDKIISALKVSNFNLNLANSFSSKHLHCFTTCITIRLLFTKVSQV